MRPRDRHEQIIDRIAREGSVTVDALSEDFAVSAETIRRDLTLLASDGRVMKVHGGARAPVTHVEGSFDERMHEGAAAKAQIAAKVAGLIPPGSSLFIDTGTTTVACARQLAEVADLTIVTNSPRIAQIIARGTGGAKVFLLGGAYGAENDETLGPMVMAQVAAFHADFALIGVAAMDAQAGASDADANEAAVARAMCANARKVIILAHSDKFQRRALHVVCAPDRIDVLVCDELPEPPIVSALARAGVTLC